MLGRAYLCIRFSATAYEFLHVCIYGQVKSKINLQYYNMWLSHDRQSCWMKSVRSSSHWFVICMNTHTAHTENIREN